MCRNCGMPHITSFGISFVGAPPASMLILMPADSASPPKRVRTFQNSLRKKGNFPQFIKFIKISCEIFCSHLQVAFRCSKLLRQGFLLRHFRVRGILWDLGAFLEKKRHPFLVTHFWSSKLLGQCKKLVEGNQCFWGTFKKSPSTCAWIGQGTQCWPNP